MPARDVLLPGRDRYAVAHDEEVGAHPLRNVAVRVQQHGPGVGVLRLDLHVGLDHVDVVVHLGPRAHRLRRRPPDGWSHDLQPVAVVRGTLGEGERVALDHKGRPPLRRSSDPAAHALRYPVVVVIVQQRKVGVQHLHRQVDHLVLADAGVDAHVLQRAVQPVEVVGQPEEDVAERASRVEDGVAVEEAEVVGRDAGLTLGNDLTVDVGDSLAAHIIPPHLARRCGLPSISERLSRRPGPVGF